MRNIRKWSLVIAVMAALTMTACSSNAAKTSQKDGGAAEVKTLTGEADGIGGAVKVEVKADAEKIHSVTVTEHKETDGIGTKAVDEIPGAIVEKQSLNVDAVSGATVTSDAIKNAVKAALESGDIDVSKFN